MMPSKYWCMKSPTWCRLQSEPAFFLKLSLQQHLRHTDKPSKRLSRAVQLSRDVKNTLKCLGGDYTTHVCKVWSQKKKCFLYPVLALPLQYLSILFKFIINKRFILKDSLPTALFLNLLESLNLTDSISQTYTQTGVLGQEYKVKFPAIS